MAFVLGLKIVAVECYLEQQCRIDEKERVIDRLFVAESGEDPLGYHLISRLSKRHVRQSGYVGIDCNVQPEPFVIQLEHGLVNRDVIRIIAIKGL